MTARLRPFLAVAVVAVLAAACAASSSPSPSPSSPASSPVPVATPTPAGNPSAEPSAPVTPGEPSTDPSANPSPTPEPTVKPAAWSKPRAVKGLSGCFDVVATVDDAGTSHLAATCGPGGTEIRYASSPDGRRWSVQSFRAPTGRFEQDPEIAFSGSTLYLASTRLAPDEEGCGSDGLQDVGVYVRSRSLPGGDWSAPARIGATADHLAGLRVSDGVIHAIVTNEQSDATFYERVSGGDTQRVRVGGASNGVALRVGDDGLARIARDSAKGIQFGQVSGGKLITATIPGTVGGGAPLLALGPGNTAYVLWTISAGSGGCIDMDPGPRAGTYLSTDAGGSWQTTKLSRVVGASSLTMDPATGEVDVLVSGFDAPLQVFVKPAASGWTHRTLTTDFASSTVVRRNPVTGGLFVAYVRETLDGDVPATVQVITQD
jgi:hypothetical protein